MPLRYRLGRTLEYLLVPAKRRCHSPGAKKGFVKGEVLRLLSINSSRSTFNKNRHLFKILLNYKKKNYLKEILKFALRGCISPKITCGILAHKGSQTTSATPEWYSFFLLWACVFFVLFCFFLFFFFNQGLSSVLDFSMSKDFSIDRELPCVNLVEWTWRTPTRYTAFFMME